MNCYNNYFLTLHITPGLVKYIKKYFYSVLETFKYSKFTDKRIENVIKLRIWFHFNNIYKDMNNFVVIIYFGSPCINL